MPQVPRIRRVEPSGNAVKPVHPLAVIATLIWHDGARDEVTAHAVAWTRAEVEIEWTTARGDIRRDWLRADQIRRA